MDFDLANVGQNRRRLGFPWQIFERLSDLARDWILDRQRYVASKEDSAAARCRSTIASAISTRIASTTEGAWIQLWVLNGERFAMRWYTAEQWRCMSYSTYIGTAINGRRNIPNTRGLFLNFRRRREASTNTITIITIARSAWRRRRRVFIRHGHGLCDTIGAHLHHLRCVMFRSEFSIAKATRHLLLGRCWWKSRERLRHDDKNAVQLLF